MKLEYYQNGRQFFFITLAVEGRKKMLAEVVEETHEEQGQAPEPLRRRVLPRKGKEIAQL